MSQRRKPATASAPGSPWTVPALVLALVLGTLCTAGSWPMGDWSAAIRLTAPSAEVSGRPTTTAMQPPPRWTPATEQDLLAAMQAESVLVVEQTAARAVRSVAHIPPGLATTPVVPLSTQKESFDAPHESVAYQIELTPEVEAFETKVVGPALPDAQPTIDPPAESIAADATAAAELNVPPVAEPFTPRDDKELTGGAFPMPRRLIERLDRLVADPAASDWAAPVHRLVLDLSEVVAADDPAVSDILVRLAAAARRSEDSAATFGSPIVQTEIRRVGYALTRRLPLWGAVHVTSSRLHASGSTDRTQQLAERFDKPAGASHLASFHPLPRDGRSESARSERYGDLIDAQQLLARLEEFELNRRPSQARDIAAQRALLASAAAPEVRRVVEHLDEHYRNANFRIAITEALLDRMLPQPKAFGRRVSDYYVGVPVQGYSTTTTRLDARLIPDATCFRLGLEVHGQVESQTAARSAPATLFSRGDTSFVARKLLLVTPRGLTNFPAVADADNNNRLVGVRSDFDEVPLIGSIVRDIAREEHNDRRGAVNREVERNVAREARAQFDRQVTPLVEDASQRFAHEVWRRLERLGLEPAALEMDTTAERLTARLRFAAEDQLAAHTPRPRAPGDSLLSVQLHESLLNNALEQLELNGKELSLPEVFRQVANRTGADEFQLPEDVPDDVKITFAPKNALQVHFIEGAMRLTIALSRVEQGRYRWSNLVVRAFYKPQGDGLDARLVREPGIQLAGDRISGRSQIILRGVFAKLLDHSSEIPLVPPRLREDSRLADLEVTQLQVHDGWLGVAIGPKNSRAAEDELAEGPRWRAAYIETQSRWK